MAKDVLRFVFPDLSRRADSERNPDVVFPAVVASHDEQLDLRLVWYNSRRLGQSNGRDEARLTRWGGAGSIVVSPESTGALVVFAYHRLGRRDADALQVWLARNESDHDLIIDRVGPVEPGVGLVLTSSGVLISGATALVDRPCAFTSATLPGGWESRFPSGEEMISQVVSALPTARDKLPDDRLLLRRQCEYEMFRSVESLHVLPRLQEPFATVDIFVEYAHTVTNRRKSRSGRSLELQLASVFREEGLGFSSGAYTEGRRKPDFIFPSIESYWDGGWPDARLRMLGAKTTVKDRWRQILNEARRVEPKHLLTLQEGVSEEQFSEMHEEGVILVVPRGLQKHYPVSIRPKLLTLSGFIRETKEKCQ
jgi:hypothetical protein